MFCRECKVETPNKSKSILVHLAINVLAINQRDSERFLMIHQGSLVLIR